MVTGGFIGSERRQSVRFWQTAAQFAFSIKTAGVQQRADKPVQPFHAEYFVLYEVPHA